MKDPSLQSPSESQSDNMQEAKSVLESASSRKPLYILAPFVPTPQDVVDRMLKLGNVTDTDVLYDLGCGDGRIVITAAKKYGARAFGVAIVSRTSRPDTVRDWRWMVRRSLEMGRA